MSRNDPSGPGRKRDENRRPSPHPGGGSTGGAEDDPNQDGNAGRRPKE